jgi:hypothetical protein
VTAPHTFAGFSNQRVRAWAEQHPDPRIRELAERWGDLLDELAEALEARERAELMLDETVERLAVVEQRRAELEAQLAPPAQPED